MLAHEEQEAAGRGRRATAASGGAARCAGGARNSAANCRELCGVWSGPRRRARPARGRRGWTPSRELWLDLVAELHQHARTLASASAASADVSAARRAVGPLPRPTALCDLLRLKPLPKTLEDIERSFPYVGVQPADHAHLDAMCHVNNATYLQYFETARTRSLVELLGIEVTFEAKGKAPVLQDTWVSYRRPTFLFDTLRRVALRAEDLARSTASWCTDI